MEMTGHIDSYIVTRHGNFSSCPKRNRKKEKRHGEQRVMKITDFCGGLGNVGMF